MAWCVNIPRTETGFYGKALKGDVMIQTRLGFFMVTIISFVLTSADGLAQEVSVICGFPDVHTMSKAEFKAKHSTFVGKNASFLIKDPDRLGGLEEIKLARNAVTQALPYLDEEMREVVSEFSFVVEHRWPSYTKTYLGWSAEDDPLYDELTTELFHVEKNPKGKIRAVFTEKFIQFLKLGTLIPENDRAARLGHRAFVSAIVAHEITHVLQYHKHPVRDVERFAGNDFKDGLVLSEDLMHGVEQKIEYERDAMEIDRSIIQSVADGQGKRALLALADKIESMRKDPKLQKALRSYLRLMGGDQPNDIVEYYARSGAKELNLGREFAPQHVATYEGQLVPLKVVYGLVRLKQNLKDGKITLSEAIRERDTLARQMEGIRQNQTVWVNLKSKVLTYLTDVENRYEREMQALGELLGN